MIAKKEDWVFDFELGIKAAQQARLYVGQKELPGNKGFIDKNFEKLMRGIGFYTGAPWCGFIPKLSYKSVGLNHLFISASSKRQIDATAKGKPMEFNWFTEPVIGAVVVWARFVNGERQSNGHFSIVVDIIKDGDETIFVTVDGNSNNDGSREGDEVVIKDRILNKAIWTKKNGLRLLGFVYPTSQKGSISKGLMLEDGKK